MKKRQLFFIFTFIIGSIMLNACSDSNSNIGDIPTSNVSLSLKLDDKLKEAVVHSVSIKGTEVNTDKKINEVFTEVKDNSISLNLKPGLYNFSIIAKATLNNENLQFTSSVENMEVNGVAKAEVKLRPSVVSSNFVIEEIFYKGSVYPNTNEVYDGDQYFKITNNSDEVLYADGLTIGEGEFDTDNQLNYKPDRKATDVAVLALYQIPGNGQDHPVQPGESIVICDKAINHIAETGIPTTFDLSNADFEWYDESPFEWIKDTDNPDVPNMNVVYNMSYTLWHVNQNGNRAYILLRMGVDTDTFMANYEKEYSYFYDGMDSERYVESYFVPNDWIIDAVNISNKDTHQWLTIDSSLDAGYTYCGEYSDDPKGFGTSVRRKVAFTDEVTGRKVLQDTNNSSEDFMHSAEPSLSGKSAKQ